MTGDYELQSHSQKQPCWGQSLKQQMNAHGICLFFEADLAGGNLHVLDVAPRFFVTLKASFVLQVSIVNSSWTAGHIRQLWWRLKAPTVIFPPCNTLALQQLQLDRKLKRLYLISVAQFRPEKNHRLQLEAFALARQLAMQDADHGTVSVCWLSR